MAMGITRRNRDPAYMRLTETRAPQWSKLVTAKPETPSRRGLGFVLLITFTAALWLLIFWAVQGAFAMLAG